MDINAVGTVFFAFKGDINGIYMLGIDSGAYFHRHGDGDGAFHGGDKLSAQCGAFHERASVAVIIYFGHGTAHVYIDGGGRQAAFAFGGGVCHDLRLAAEKLYRGGAFVVVYPAETPCFQVTVAYCLGGYHFGRDVLGAATDAEAAERVVGHARKRREKETVSEVQIAYFHG